MRSMVEGAPVVRQASRPTPLPPPFGRSPLPAVAGRDEVERAERAARTNFYFVIASEAKQSSSMLAALDCFVAFAPRNAGWTALDGIRCAKLAA